MGGDTVPNWKGAVGGHSMGATNERGEKAIANTLLKHKRSRMVTWHALNGQSYQIDFIMVSNK